MRSPQLTIWHMPLACCIPKPASTHSEYAIKYCFPTTKTVERTRLKLRYTYSGCLAGVLWTAVSKVTGNNLEKRASIPDTGRRTVFATAQPSCLRFQKTATGRNMKRISSQSTAVITFTRNYTGLFISPSGISEIDCATTKTDTAERSISIRRESLNVFFLY